MQAPLWQAPLALAPGDPYGLWGAATGWSGQPAPASGALWVPLLAPDDAALAAFLATAPEGGARLGALHPDGARWRVVWVRADLGASARQALPLAEFSQPRGPLRAAAPQTSHPRPDRPAGWPEEVPLVMAAIDSGGAFLHRAFRHPDAPARTRIVAVWDQDQDPGPVGSPFSWTVPPGGHGRELRAEALQALCERADARLNGERAVYAELGLPDLLLAEARNEADHATHVLDTLAGLPEPLPRAACAKPAQLDAAACAPLILVSMPSAPAGQTTGTPVVAQILEGLHYILAQANTLSERCPVVVNISLGVLGGPHDGSSALEQAIDDLMTQHPRLLVVFAAGNTASGPVFNAAGELPAGAEASLAWRLQPQDPTDSFLEFWWQGEGSAGVQWRVQGPWASPWVALDQCSELRAGGRLLGQLGLQTVAPTPGRPRSQQPGPWQGRGQLSLAAVAGPRGGLPAGIWQLAVRNTGAAPVQLQVRVQGDGNRWLLSGGAQSFLDGASGGLVLGAAGSLNGLATGQQPLVVGAAEGDTGRASRYSCRRGAVGGRRVDALALADEGAFAPGLVAAGVLSGTWVRMNGTSVAAPVAARHWAQRAVASGLPSSGQSWRELLAPRRKGPPAPDSPNQPGGSAIAPDRPKRRARPPQATSS